MQEIAAGLRFPEGPIAMPDGSVVLVEIARGALSRVGENGKVEVIAELGGGPNGAALGPDGMIYVCNNGGFIWHEAGGLLIPGDRPDNYSGGRIERVDPATGKAEVLYTQCGGNPLNGPNDIVFDGAGGFWFTDLGKSYGRQQDRGAVFYARADGSGIKEVLFPMNGPNGIGLSPDGKRLYVAETPTARLWGFDVGAPGEIVSNGTPWKGDCLAGLPEFAMFDSLAVDSAGTVCVATLLKGGITTVSADGRQVGHVALGDAMTTNICFGGQDLKTAFITLSSSGRLVAVEWPRPGLRLHHA